MFFEIAFVSNKCTNDKNVFAAFSIGQGFAAGAAALGIGALCFYGLGLGKEVGAIDRSV
jgi:hypothetical protein